MILFNHEGLSSPPYTVRSIDDVKVEEYNGYATARGLGLVIPSRCSIRTSRFRKKQLDSKLINTTFSQYGNMEYYTHILLFKKQLLTYYT